MSAFERTLKSHLVSYLSYRKIGHVVREICSRTDTDTETQTHTLITILVGRSNSNVVVQELAAATAAVASERVSAQTSKACESVGGIDLTAHVPPPSGDNLHVASFAQKD